MKKNVILVSFFILVMGLMAQTAIIPVGNGTEENPYQIATWQNLYWITAPGTVDGLRQAERWTKHYIQTGDIDFANATPTISTWNHGTGWSPIGLNTSYLFRGSYDGNNKTITGLYINRPMSSYQGLFGFTIEAEIKNVSLINTCITGNDNSGGLVGYNYFYSTISNCYLSGSVTGTEGLIGGLVGFNLISNPNYCNTGNIIKDINKGRLVENIKVNQINNCFWDIETSCQSSSDGCTGKTTVEMKNISTFTDAGWSFPDVWKINPGLNNGYPYLGCYNSVTNEDIINIPPTDSKALLMNAYPNPFNPSTTLSFELSSPEIVKIDIYNVKGQLVKSLVKGLYNTGKHSIIWDGRDNKGKSACSGVYFFRMQAGKHSQTKKMMLMK